MTKTRQWSIFTAVAVLIVFVAGWMLLIKPQKSKASDLRVQATDAQSQVTSLAQQIAQLQSQQRNLPQEQKALQHFATQVPDGPNEPAILRQLSSTANGAGVDLISVTPGNAAPVSGAASSGSTTLGSTTAAAPTGLTALPLALAVSGTYPNLEMFFQALEKLPRSMLVASWSICPVSSGAAGGASSSGSGCSAPSLPLASGQSAKPGTLAASLQTTVFFSGATAPTASTGGSATTSNTTSTGTSSTTGTQPSTAPSTAASAPSK